MRRIRYALDASKGRIGKDPDGVKNAGIKQAITNGIGMPMATELFARGAALTKDFNTTVTVHPARRFHRKNGGRERAEHDLQLPGQRRQRGITSMFESDVAK